MKLWGDNVSLHVTFGLYVNLIYSCLMLYMNVYEVHLSEVTYDINDCVCGIDVLSFIILYLHVT